MIPLPFAQSSVGAIGADSGNPIAVSGIKADQVLVSIIKWKVGENPASVVVSSFVVTDGAIESASVSTDGYYLHIIWLGS